MWLFLLWVILNVFFSISQVDYDPVPKVCHVLPGRRPAPTYLHMRSPEQRSANCKCQSVFKNECHKSPPHQWKQSKYPSADEWMNKMWYIYTMECHLAIKRNVVSVPAAIWMNLKIMMLQWKKPVTKDHLYVILFTWNLQKRKILNIKSN